MERNLIICEFSLVCDVVNCKHKNAHNMYHPLTDDYGEPAGVCTTEFCRQGIRVDGSVIPVQALCIPLYKDGYYCLPKTGEEAKLYASANDRLRA